MKVIIIGGGPAGMMAGISASKNKDNQVFLYEKNEKLGKKLFITGKGRCNLTNNCDILDFYKNIVTNEKFMYSSFDKFNNKDLIGLLKENGLKTKVERGNRVFPESDKAYDVTDCLKRILKKQGVIINLNTEVKKIDQKENCILIKNKITDEEEKVSFDKLIITTGGASYKSTGSTGDGYKFAKNLSINTIKEEPSLVPIEVQEKDECYDMMGLSLVNVSIKVYDEDNKKKTIYEDFGEMLFTHFGLSGPMILSASCYLTKNICENKNIIISIDLKPALDIDELDKRLLREIDNNINKKLRYIISTLLPSSMIDIFLNRLNNIYNIDIEKKNNEITKEDRKGIIELLKNFKYHFSKKRDFDEAIITQGGIDVKEIDPKTMATKKYNNIFFAGEVLDVDCLTGGFNMQVAFSTGYVAGLD